MVDLLKVFTLGGLSIQRGDSPVTGFVSRKVEALLVYLICERREHPREMLAELLWDDLAANRAMANLRMVLSSLQGQLADYLIVTRQTVSMKPESPIWCDIDELEAGLTLADDQWTRKGRLLRSAVAKLETALTFYRGEFLEGFHLRDSRGFEGWQLLERERLRGRVLEGLRHLVSYYLERGEYSGGIAHATRLLQIDPLWEESHRQLMLLLARDGQRSAALAQYETCRDLLKEELDVEPADETVALYKQIQAGDLPPVAAAPQSYLPIPPTPFINRPTELAQIAERLDNAACRLLTLVGPGGIGKTRLALQAAEDRVGDFRGGVYFVPLASLNSADSLALAIASTLRLSFQGQGTPAKELIQYLRDREVLLVMDNFEDVLSRAEFLSEILSSSPGVKILVTSRERLNLHEEWILPVEGMGYPTNGSVNSEGYGALRLFEQSARRVNPDFSLAANQKAAVHICKLVEGLPLGIELAATWVRMMPCEQIAGQIEHDLDFLATTLRNVPERHRSIRVLFEESWTELSPQERSVLMGLSVFRSGFTQEAATKVARATLPVMLSLIEKSLVRTNASGHYDMHQLLRRYSGEKLAESGRAAIIDEAHCAFFAARAEQMQKDSDASPKVYEDVSTEYNDYIAALDWADQHHHAEHLLRLAARLTFYWQGRGYSNEARTWLTKALVYCDEEKYPGLTASTLSGAGIVFWSQGDMELARQSLEKAVALWHALGEKGEPLFHTLTYLGYVALNTGDFVAARSISQEILTLARERGDKVGMARATANLGLIASETGDYQTAQAKLEEALVMFRELGRVRNIGVLLNNLGVLALQRNDYEGAATYYQESLEIAQSTQDKTNTAITQGNLGEIAQKMGDFTKAQSLYRECLRIFQELGDKLNTTRMLETYAYLAVDMEEPDNAVAILGAVDTSRKALGAPRAPRESTDYDQKIAIARAQLGETRFVSAWAEGGTMTLDQVLSTLVAT